MTHEKIMKIRNDFENAVSKFNKDPMNYAFNIFGKELCFEHLNIIRMDFIEREKAIQRLENGGYTLSELIHRAEQIERPFL